MYIYRLACTCSGIYTSYRLRGRKAGKGRGTNRLRCRWLGSTKVLGDSLTLSLTAVLTVKYCMVFS